MLFFLFGFSRANTGVITMDCVHGNDKEKTEVRKTPPFSGLHVDGAFNVYVACGQDRNVSVSGDSNIVPLIATEVRNNTLHLFPRKSVCAKIPITIRIAIANIHSLYTTGANDIDVSNISSRKLDFSGDGSGDTRLSGKTEALTVNLSGAINLRAGDLKADKVRITANDSTGAVVHAARKLHAISNDVGEIVYYGNPDDVTKQENDIGEITGR